MVSVSALAEPFAQRLRLVGSGLKFYVSSSNMVAIILSSLENLNKVKYINQHPEVVFICFYIVTRFSINFAF